MPKIAIDTSNGFTNITLEKNKLYFSKKSTIKNNQSEELALLLQELLEEHKLKIKDLSQIYSIIGPGSFTGIRTGIAFIKGLSLATNIEIIAAPSFYLLLNNFLTSNKYVDKKINIAIDCYKNQQEFFYLQIDSKYNHLSEYKIIDLKKYSALKENTEEIFIDDKNYNELDLVHIFQYQNCNNLEFSPLYLKNSYVG